MPVSKHLGCGQHRKARSLFPLVLFGAVAVSVLLGFYAYKSNVDAENQKLSKPLEGHRKNAPYIPSPQDVVDLILEVSELDSDDVLFDLGCGDGRIVISAAKQFGCRGVGYEYDAEIAELARQKVKEAGVDDLVTIYQRDIFTISDVELNEATVVTLYLLDWMNKKLIPQLRTLDDGKLIVSHDWGLNKIKPDRIEKIQSLDDPEKKLHHIRVWATPLGPEPETDEPEANADSKVNVSPPSTSPEKENDH